MSLSFAPQLPPAPRIAPAGRATGDVVAVLAAFGDGFETEQVEELIVEFEGIPGDRHHGWTRGADARVPWYERGTPVRNTRQISLVSTEELAAIATAMDLDEIRPEWLGANVTIRGVPRLSFLPPGTRLFLADGPVLAVEAQNAPCRHPARAIAARHPERSGLDLLFPKVARRLRGLVASVERPGRARAGAAVDVRTPEQWIYGI